MEEFFTAISNFGFPIVVAAYLLFRFEKKIDEMSKKIDDLNTLIRYRNNK